MATREECEKALWELWEKDQFVLLAKIQRISDGEPYSVEQYKDKEVAGAVVSEILENTESYDRLGAWISLPTEAHIAKTARFTAEIRSWFSVLISVAALIVAIIAIYRTRN